MKGEVQLSNATICVNYQGRNVDAYCCQCRLVFPKLLPKELSQLLIRIPYKRETEVPKVSKFDWG